MTAYTMQSQINLNRKEQAEKLNTRLEIRCATELEVFNDSLQSLVQTYQVNFDLLENIFSATKIDAL